MPTILRGRRANQHFGLAKNLLDSVKRAGLLFVSRVIEIPGGRIHVQNNPFGGLINIEVRDPYCVLILRMRPASGAPFYVKIYGGLTGEPFYAELPYTAVAGEFNGTADLQAVGNYTGIAADIVGAVIPPALVTFGGRSTMSLAKVKMVFNVTNWQLGINAAIPVIYTVECTTDAEPIVETLPIGEDAARSAVVLARFRVEPTPGTRYDELVKITKAENLPTPVTVWPINSLNGGRPDLARINSFLCCTARGDVMFIESYEQDWRDAAAPTERLPDIVRLTAFATIAEVIPLLTLMPTLAAYVVDGRLPLGVGSAFAYSGDGHITAIIKISNFVVLTSADNGATWTEIVLPAPDGPSLLYVPAFNAPSLYSMQKRHVEFTTYNTVTLVKSLWISLDHGATWTHTPYPTGFFGRFPGLGTPLDTDADDNVTRYARIGLKDGDSNTIKIVVHPQLSVTEVMYEQELPAGDYEARPGEFASFPTLCVLGSPEFPIPIMPGHPGFLEFSV